MNSSRFLLLTLSIFLTAPHAKAASPACRAVFASETVRQIEQRLNEVHPRDHIEIFEAKPFQYGGFLLEFFGPMQNSFPAWLRWLESDDMKLAPPQGPDLYYSDRGLIIGKFMQYPADAGASQFRSFDDVGKTVTPLLEFSTEEMTNMRGSSERAVKARTKFLSHLDTYLFGLYGALKSDSYENLMMRTSIAGDQTLSLSLRPNRKFRVKNDVVRPRDPKFKSVHNPLEDFEKVAKVIAESEDTVVVKVRLGADPGKTLSENEETIQRMFFITHWQMVQKAYRETRLFEDKVETALYLLDDFVKTMHKPGSEQTVYLMYDRTAWHSMRRRMSLAHRYVAVEMHGIGLQGYNYQTIPEVFAPFYPLYGLIAEKEGVNEFELKRLFRNDQSDPLRMLPPRENSKDLNMFFYHEITTQLPANARVKVVSKSAVHTRLYKSVGFKLEKSEYHEEWKTNKDTLSQTREEFLAHTPSNVERFEPEEE